MTHGEFANVREMVEDIGERFCGKVAYRYRVKPHDKEVVKVNYEELRDDIRALGSEIAAKGLAGKKSAEADDVANAFTLGVEAAYKAVMNPTEGTILTVARLGYEKAKSLQGKVTDETQLWEEVCVAPLGRGPGA